MDAQFWDDMYRSADQLHSGNPNGVLVTEATDLAPGRALDVGCGEGGDALWLARRGWRVTGLDISPTALERAAAAAADLSGRMTWSRADLAVTPPPAAAFDLVSAQYFPLLREPDHTALHGLLDAVAPGGTLLYVGHDLADLPPREEMDVDPGVYYQPAEIAGLLGHDWTVLIDEIRPRTAAAPPGTRHTRDTVLRARRVR
ncbi:class I SAM-dependent methyltransferase [Streptomyces sp. NPDC021098]|uniref:class I SAM-dependent methyltransferase n=1 Tax=unclassified Streptomyces TaxID=2593676 RepID=UPI0037973C08